jgi:hypothetical protein
LITAVDSNVLLDVLGADPTFGAASREALRRCVAEGELIACDVVWAEMVGALPSEAVATEAMRRLGLRFSPLEARAAGSASESWRAYRRAGGERARLVADFLTGAHAQHQADRLLTRDRGFYRSYFKDLDIVDPAIERRSTSVGPST